MKTCKNLIEIKTKLKTGFPDILKNLELEIKQQIEAFLTAPLLQLK